jgi:hypothetical protein
MFISRSAYSYFFCFVVGNDLCRVTGQCKVISQSVGKCRRKCILRSIDATADYPERGAKELYEGAGGGEVQEEEPSYFPENASCNDQPTHINTNAFTTIGASGCRGISQLDKAGRRSMVGEARREGIAPVSFVVSSACRSVFKTARGD